MLDPVKKLRTCSRSRSARALAWPGAAAACSTLAASSTGDSLAFIHVPTMISSRERTASRAAIATSAVNAMSVSTASVSRLWLESTRL